MSLTRTRIDRWAAENASAFAARQRAFNKCVAGTLLSLLLACVLGDVLTVRGWYWSTLSAPLLYLALIYMFWHWYNRFETKTPIPTFEEWEAKNPDTVEASGFWADEPEG
jgi:hypothetical protein